MRFGFVTCVQLGLSCLEAIRELGSEPDLLVTLRDDLAVRKSGRVWLDDFAASGENKLVKVDNINDPDAKAAIAEADLDWLFVVGWSQIVGSDVLALPRLGCIGMHPTLLPVGRGRAPIPWAIIKNLEETGVTMFVLDSGVDTGPVLAQSTVTVEADETATTLYEKVDQVHISLIREAWPALASGSAKPWVQDETKATVWPGRRPEDGQLLPTMTVDEMDRHVRALTEPYPGAWVRDTDGATWLIDAGSTQEPETVLMTVPAINGTYFVVKARRSGPST